MSGQRGAAAPRTPGLRGSTLPLRTPVSISGKMKARQVPASSAMMARAAAAGSRAAQIGRPTTM